MKTFLKQTLSAAGLIALAATAATAQDCRVDLRESPNGTIVQAYSDARGASFYTFRLTEASRGSRILVDTRGQVRPSYRGETRLVSTLVAHQPQYRFNARDEGRSMRYSNMRFSRYVGDLVVYNRRGRVVCTAQEVDIVETDESITAPTRNYAPAQRPLSPRNSRRFLNDF